MIPCDFVYYRPDTAAEAVDIYCRLREEGRQPHYYSGGTEIITMARLNQLHIGAVVDLKGISACHALETRDNRVTIGSALTLTQIERAEVFPLLGRAGGRVADHTVRDKITLGGNICGRFIYKEAVLALLVADAELVLVGPAGERLVPIAEAFDRALRLADGEFLLQVVVDAAYPGMPYVHIKRTRMAKVNYPLVTVAALRKDGQVRVAFSGLCDFPFRSQQMEADLNDSRLPLPERIDLLFSHLPAPTLNSIEGSAEFRQFLLRNALTQTMMELDGVS